MTAYRCMGRRSSEPERRLHRAEAALQFWSIERQAQRSLRLTRR